MKEIVTLVSSLPFTNVSVSILPITSENFYLFFIGFLVTFFLLGIIIGYILNPRRNSRRTKEKPLIDAAKMDPEPSKDSGQDSPMMDINPQRRMDSYNPRNRSSYNNNWDYSRPPRRY